MLPSLKERVEKVLRRGLASIAFANPKEPPLILTDEILSLLNERTDEVVKVLREGMRRDEGTTWQKLSERFNFKITPKSQEGFIAGLDCAYAAFDTASLSLKPDEERE